MYVVPRVVYFKKGTAMTKEQVLKEVGEMCRRRRHLAGLNIDYIAQMTGYSPATISMFERGLLNNLFLYLCYYEVIKDVKDCTFTRIT